jgi:lipopolysaccharide export system protein LptA
MALEVKRLRRWFAAAAIVLILAVVGVYLHVRRGVQDVLKQVPGKIGVDIQQTATGFKVSKSLQNRTLFTIEASRAVEFKEGGHTELHNVNIILYGRDSSRYDQIRGDDFEYDPKSGDVTAKGEVRIDLEANPEGILKPDQAAPSNLKNPIHLVTHDLVFNQKTGDAVTPARVDLDMPQARGSAVGLTYSAKDNLLRLRSQVVFTLVQAGGVTVNAARAAITKIPRQVVLESPQVKRAAMAMTSDQAILDLRENNTLERITATGNVQTEMAGSTGIHGRADNAEFVMSDDGSTIRSADLTGAVHFEAAGDHPYEGSSGRVLLAFGAKDSLETIRAEQDVKLAQLPSPAGKGTADAQLVEVRAPAIDFYLAGGRRLDHAQTSPGSQVVFAPAQPNGTRTVLTAQTFRAQFNQAGRLNAVHGEPDARIVSTNPGHADRVSTSRAIEVAFAAQGGGVTAVTQQGDVLYHDGDLTASGQRADYTPATQILTLNGDPRVTEKGMVTTARSMRMDRATGDATAEGNVKTTYSNLREQPGGALLASSSPIHVTANKMDVRRASSVALYSGNVRLWQDSNVIQAPTIQFDQAQRSILATGDGQPVSTVLVEIASDGKVTPVTITSRRLSYADSQHVAQFTGGVTARGSDGTMTAASMDAYLVPRSQEKASDVSHGQGQLDRIVANGDVSVSQPGRRATGQNLVYTAVDDRFVMTGGPPSIFDAEHGKITGDSLTFYKRDDRVLVEGREASPTVTTTRVAR